MGIITKQGLLDCDAV